MKQADPTNPGVPRGWRSVAMLIADGYRAEPTDLHNSFPDATMKDDFDLRVARFLNDAAGDFMHAGTRSMLAWRGDPGEAIERTVTPSAAGAMVEDNLVVEVDDEFYLSPDAVASLETTGSISKSWAVKGTIAGARPGRGGGKSAGRAPD